MRSRLLVLIALLALGLIKLPLLHATEQKQHITLSGDPWPPYIIGKLGEEATGGVGVRLMYAIFDRLDDVELSIPMVPWKRALREVRHGTKDGIAILLKTPKREQYMVYSDELFRSFNTVWYSTANFPNGFYWHQYDDFKPYTIGVVQGHSYGDELDEMIDEGTLAAIKVPSVRKLFAMLKKKRIELAIADRLVGEAFVRQRAGVSQRLQAADKPAAGEVYYIALSKKSEARHLIPAINGVVAELKKEGVIDKLIGEASTD
ncbi:MAG: substrate-binding periplasmic protein [Pseudomonadales bacterium]